MVYLKRYRNDFLGSLVTYPSFGRVAQVTVEKQGRGINPWANPTWPDGYKTEFAFVEPAMPWVDFNNRISSTKV